MGKGLCVALPTETKVESGTSQSKCGTSVNLSNSGFRGGGPPGDPLSPSEGFRPSGFVGFVQWGCLTRAMWRIRLLLLFFITLKPRVE